MDDASSTELLPPADRTRPLARRVLYVFLLTFIATRVLVFLIMARLIPDLYLHVRGTHIHHLNHGIFLLAIVGGYLLFRRPRGRELAAAATAYAIGLALTFDEFGMWLRLGGPYWQRASFDAIVVIAAALALVAYGPGWRRLRQNWFATLLLGTALVIFTVLLIDSLNRAGRHFVPRVSQLESLGPG